MHPDHSPMIEKGGFNFEVQHFKIESAADAKGFVVLAKCWVVERTHAWNERARRLIMHHDRLAQVAEPWVWLTEARLLLRRLAT